MVIFLFLRSVRTTIVAAVSIPLSVLVALLLVARAGFTLNIMTLGGIAIAVGRIVDDSIVVLENIFRHRQDGEDSRTAVIRGTRKDGTDMESARTRLEANAGRLVPAGGTFTVQAVAAGPPNQGIAEFVSANDDATLRGAARMVRDAVALVPDTTNVRSDLSTAKPQVYVDVDPGRAARHGLSPLAVAAAIRGLVAGQDLGTLRLPGNPVDQQVNLAVDQAAISSVRGLSTMAIVPGVRPILMTAMATILALAPLASGLSNGNTIIAANLATVVIGGLFTSTVLTLVVVPVVYSIFERFWGKRARQAEAPDYEGLPAPASIVRPADAPSVAH